MSQLDYIEGSEGLCPHCKHYDTCKGSTKLFPGSSKQNECDGNLVLLNLGSLNEEGIKTDTFEYNGDEDKE